MKLRGEAQRKLLAKPDWPDKEPVPLSPAMAQNFVVKSLLDLREEIKGADIPPSAKEDMLADYWNKWAFITWERAILEEDPEERRQWLGFVSRYLDLIQQDPDRASWTPWQVNRVRLLLAQSLTQPPPGPKEVRPSDSSFKKEQAKITLSQTLGIDPSPPPQPAPAASDNSAQIADMIAKMAEVPDAIAIASNLRRSNPGLSQEAIGKITALLAGRIPAPLLDQIFRQYSSCQ